MEDEVESLLLGSGLRHVSWEGVEMVAWVEG